MLCSRTALFGWRRCDLEKGGSFPVLCSGQQMDAVCFILALLLYDESWRIQPLNTQQMEHFSSSPQLSLSSPTTYSGVEECMFSTLTPRKRETLKDPDCVSWHISMRDFLLSYCWPLRCWVVVSQSNESCRVRTDGIWSLVYRKDKLLLTLGEMEGGSDWHTISPSWLTGSHYCNGPNYLEA